MSKYIILDRDGVINHDSAEFVKNIDEFIIYPNSLQAIANLTQNNYKIIICTNQSGIGRGLFSVADLNEMHNKLIQEVRDSGGNIEAIVFCPHTTEDNCNCRKPKPGMILDICERLNLDITQTMMVGDSIRDLQAIKSAGGIPVLVKTGNGKKTFAKEQLPEGTLVFNDLLEVSIYLINHTDKDN